MKNLKTIFLLVPLIINLNCKANRTQTDGNEWDYTPAEASDEADYNPGQPDGLEDEEDTSYGLSITGLMPDHGPFTGGNQVLVKGSGFEEGMNIYFGSHSVQPSVISVENENRLWVVAPANQPGMVDVKIEKRDEQFTLHRGYTYDIFYLDPPSGSKAGGTYVEITGSNTNFSINSSVFFDDNEATELNVLSPTLITCKTPAGAVGLADVKIVSEEETYEVKEAFLYYDHTDPIAGGLGGGPINGTVNVTVLEWQSRQPVESAFCILADENEGGYQGYTDSSGAITFSGPSLTGKQTLTVAKEGYESQTIAEFNATDVTIFLVKYPESTPGTLPPPALGATISGELVFEHGGEFGPGPWEIVPEPESDDEVKMAFVYSTGATIWNQPPPSGMNGAHWQVADDMGNTGRHGFKFSVYSRAATVAVWAIAGVKNRVTGNFVPYAFGITRGIVAGPGEEVTGVLVYMVHELTQRVSIQLEDYFPPLNAIGGPDVYKSELFIDLGGDGVVFRNERTIIKDSPEPFNYSGWLPLSYELADAHYCAVVGAYTEGTDPLTGKITYQNPLSVKIINNITNINEPIVASDLIGIPYPVDPPNGMQLTDNHMEFGNNGGVPDFWLVLIQSYPDMLPLWRIILPGDKTNYYLPDHEGFDPIPPPPSGYAAWTIYGISVKGFNYDEFSYRYLSQNYWTAYSADSFAFRFK